MCGIAGLVDFTQKRSADAYRALATNMAQSLAHRGPDDEGTWVDDEAGAALCHRRLSIIDLSPAGHQPMESADGRFVITYNGEVYNFAALRSELVDGGARFRGESDTEVILEACARWGVDAAVRRFVGMFAFALWDRQVRTLTLVRDRLGIKPLYWTRVGSGLAFASELRAFRCLPEFKPDLDRAALSLFLRLKYVPAPRSIFADVHKLEPGTMAVVSPTSGPDVVRYWDLRRIATSAPRGAGQADASAGQTQVALATLEEHLRDAVRLRMIADVPLGAFLSGGIDSSTIVALMQSESVRPVKTFSVRFPEAAFDESDYARRVADHLGTDHTELTVDSGATLAHVPHVADVYDEPFADPSQIPTALIAALACEHVTVALSGDGGDELFGGYGLYRMAERFRRVLQVVPALPRRLAARLIRAVDPDVWDRGASLLPGRVGRGGIGDRLHKGSEILDLPSADQVYWALASHWPDPAVVVIGGSDPPDVPDRFDPGSTLGDDLARLRFLDTMLYLPDDILTKVDRASMAVGLEVRVPLIDHRLVEHVWTNPLASPHGNSGAKWPLRQILAGYVPKDLINRPKMGFGVPLAGWLRGPLRDWAEDLLAESRLAHDGIFHPDPVRRTWAEHLSGRRNWQYRLWTVLMFQCWQQRWKN